MLTKSIKRLFDRKNFYCFIYKLIILFFIVTLFDWLIGSVLHHYFFRINHEENFRTTYVLEQSREDILIFGSSRANHHYNSLLISDSLKESCFNAGRDGSFMFYHYALLKGVLKRYIPKAIILDLTAEDFYQEPQSYDRISSLLPYYHTHAELREIIRMKSRYEKYKLLSRIYPFNSNALRIITGNLDWHGKKANELRSRGYLPVYKTWGEPLQDLHEESFIDSNKISIFKLFVKECKNAGIELFVFVSPYFERWNSEREFIKIIKEITRENKIPFWDYSQNKSFLSNAGYFADINHLNAEGANIYTTKIIENIIHVQTTSKSDSMSMEYSLYY